MSILIRHFLFPENSDPLRLAQRLVDGLIHGQDAMPQYAETRQRVLMAVLDSEDGKPSSIIRTEASIWSFDENGKVDKALREAGYRFMAAAQGSAPAGETVVDLRPKLTRKQLDEEYRWTPTKADINTIIADIWPAKGTKQLKSAKGVKRKPPLTWDARQALSEAASVFWKISHAVDGLRIPSLRGLAHEARRVGAEEDRAQKGLYDGLATLADERIELLRQKESRKGIWYAVIDAYDDGADGIKTLNMLAQERCDGRDAATKAARRLMTENAIHLHPGRSIEARIMTELEWEHEQK